MDIEKRKILIAEDSPTQALQLKIILEANEFEVRAGNDGQEACSILKDYRPDLIISDIMMPNMNGFEFSTFVKSNKEYKDIPLILLTSLTDSIDVIKGLASGANTFITKPFDKDFLLEVINRTLERKDLDPQIQEILAKNKLVNYDPASISFLMSAYETAIRKNKALEESREKLEEANQNLEMKVRDRTHELEHAKKRAEKSDKLKSIFLSNVSHDLRTPMNAIIGFSELLKEGELEADMHDEYLDLISKNGENLLNLINDIIDISRIEAGVIKSNESNCQLNELLAELEKSFQKYKFLKDNRDVELIFKRNPNFDDLVIKTDAFRLKQILSNLLSNAIKFTKKGSVEFSFKKSSDDMLEFWVKDTGVGIDNNKIPGLFKRYEQVKTSDSPESGSGLGLAIAENLTKILGGKMWVESEPGIGSTFSFSIPFKPAEGPALEYFPKVEEDPHSYDFNNEMILVVEDDMSNYNYLKAVLRKANARVEWAKTGQDAIEKCRENNEIRMVLMDINLPVMNGFEATKRIKYLNEDLPVIAQTAYAMSGDEQKCYEAGCVDYMAKPIKPAVLLSKIKKNINTKTS